MSKWRAKWRFSVVSDIQSNIRHATVFGGLCKKTPPNVYSRLRQRLIRYRM